MGRETKNTALNLITAFNCISLASHSSYPCSSPLQGWPRRGRTEQATHHQPPGQSRDLAILAPLHSGDGPEEEEQNKQLSINLQARAGTSLPLLLSTPGMAQKRKNRTNMLVNKTPNRYNNMLGPPETRMGGHISFETRQQLL